LYNNVKKNKILIGWRKSRVWKDIRERILPKAQRENNGKFI